MLFSIIIMTLLLLLLLLIGVPVPFAIMLSGVAGLIGPFDEFLILITMLAQRTYSGILPFPLVAVAFFILTGVIMNSCNITEYIFQFCLALLGKVKGGIAYANILASLIFSGISGSAVADATGLGLIEIKMMKKAGYPSDFSAAITAGSSIIGPIIPPSIPLVIYGSMTGTSIGKLLIGGIVPGLMLSIALACWVFLRVKKTPYNDSQAQIPSNLFHLTLKALPALFIPIIIVWGIVSGVFTPTEASAIAATYSLLISLFIYRSINIPLFIRVLKETVEYTAKVLLIVGAASFFAWVLTYHGAPRALISSIGMIKSQLVFLFLISFVYLVLGTFMEGISIMLLTIPIFLPTVRQFGIDPVYFGVLMTVTLSIGLITPPLGICLYPVANIADVPLLTLVKSSLPIYFAFLVVLILIIVAPELVLFLPNLLFS